MAIGVVAFWPGGGEPQYNGKKLSEWLRIATTNLSTEERQIINDLQNLAGITNMSPRGLEAVRAVRAIGTNALPYLVRWTLRPPAWRVNLSHIYYGRFPAFLRSRAIVRWLYGPPDNFGLAFAGFQIMGPDEALAVPELVKIIRESPSVFAKRNAILCLMFMKERAGAALPALKEVAARIDAFSFDLGPLASEAISKIRPGSNEKGGTNWVKEF